MEIKDHLRVHKRAIRRIAFEVASQYKLSYDLAKDLAQEGSLELARAHENGYNHERASLLTYARGSMSYRMERVAQQWIGRKCPVDWDEFEDRTLDLIDSPDPTNREKARRLQEAIEAYGAEDESPINTPEFRLAWSLIAPEHRQTLSLIYEKPTMKKAAKAAGVTVKTFRKRRDEAAEAFRLFYFGESLRLSRRVGRPRGGRVDPEPLGPYRPLLVPYRGIQR
jgi:hypothetical protein